jgi:GNAT superfamily N-acetyltransferase
MPRKTKATKVVEETTVVTIPTVAQTPSTSTVRINLDEIIMEEDSLRHDCDHTTYVAKILGSPDEVGERLEISLARICVKKKTWFFTEIKHILVREEYRRQGIAKYMIDYLINNVDEANQKIIFTPVVGGTVNIDNEIAIAMLTSMGFTHATTFFNHDTGNTIKFMVKAVSLVPES